MVPIKQHPKFAANCTGCAVELRGFAGMCGNVQSKVHWPARSRRGESKFQSNSSGTAWDVSWDASEQAKTLMFMRLGTVGRLPVGVWASPASRSARHRRTKADSR